MLKKAKASLGENESDAVKGLSKSVRESSHQIWLAGLGAFAKAQEGGRQVFDALVKQGETLEMKTRKAAAQTAGAARDAAASKAREMQAVAGGTWDKLEQVFEDRVSRSLARLGVHTSSDVERLTERVNELSEAVNALLKDRGLAPKPRGKAVKSASPGRGIPTAAKTKARADAPGNTAPGTRRVARKKVRAPTKRANDAMK